MDQQRDRANQQLRLDMRKHLDISGVKEVVSFDEESVILKTVCGLLNIDGKDVKISVLDTDKGVVVLDGQVDAIYYTDEKEEIKRGFFGRLLK